MRFSTVSVVVCSFLFACGTDAKDEWQPGMDLPASVESNGDECAPANAANGDVNPNAKCARKTELHVRDLGNPKDTGPALPTEKDTGSTLRTADFAGDQTPSCNGEVGPGFNTCGINGDQNCCAAKTVPAGTADATTVVAHDFDLGVYEVTSGRFAKFVDSLDGQIATAAQGGKLPGFNPDHIGNLPNSRDQIDIDLGPGCQARSDVSNYGALTWPSQDITDLVDANITDNDDTAADIRADATAPRLHAKPINCVTYYLAEAFCAWDGGRLPSNTEWAYAALGGSERRDYPWGSDHTANRLVTDLDPNGNNDFTYPEGFPYFDNFFNAYHIAPPGNKPDGAAKWGHLDMGGNLLEWVGDISGPGLGSVRGGSWEGHEDKNSFVFTNYALDRSYGSLGIRCAYGAPQPAAPPAAVADLAIHRHYNPATGDHLLGVVQTEGDGAGWNYEGVAFMAFSQKPADPAYPLVRCIWTPNGHHFISNDLGCEGQTVEGQIGWVLAAADATSKPIYRCLAGLDHLTTANQGECINAGFAVEGSQGFAH